RPHPSSPPPRPTLSLLPFSATPAPTPASYTRSLHDALPILEMPLNRRPSPSLSSTLSAPSSAVNWSGLRPEMKSTSPERMAWTRSEEHTSELQSRFDLVCRLLLDKKKTAPRRQCCRGH